jgi:hypothetical protein
LRQTSKKGDGKGTMNGKPRPEAKSFVSRGYSMEINTPLFDG